MSLHTNQIRGVHSHTGHDQIKINARATRVAAEASARVRAYEGREGFYFYFYYFYFLRANVRALRVVLPRAEGVRAARAPVRPGLTAV